MTGKGMSDEHDEHCTELWKLAWDFAGYDTESS